MALDEFDDDSRHCDFSTPERHAVGGICKISKTPRAAGISIRSLDSSVAVLLSKPDFSSLPWQGSRRLNFPLSLSLSNRCNFPACSLLLVLVHQRNSAQFTIPEICYSDRAATNTLLYSPSLPLYRPMVYVLALQFDARGTRRLN